jgi:hypothetical protein
LLAAMAPAWSATLELMSPSGTLILSSAEGTFTVTALLGPDDFFESYDKVGEAAAQGTVRLPVGGQPIDLPACFCLDRSQALAAATQFLARGTVDIGDGWIKQDAKSAYLWQPEAPTEPSAP